MIILAILLAIIFLSYKIVTSGMTYKIVFAFFGWIGMCWAMIRFIPDSEKFGILIGHHCLSWAIIVPTIVAILAIIYVRD